MINFNSYIQIKPNFSGFSFKSKSHTLKIAERSIKDDFLTNPIYEYLGSSEKIESIAKANSKICSILDKYNIPIKANIKELEKLKKGHMHDTRVITAKIYSALPQELKKEVDIQSLQEAAMLHDYGKILIPDSILNKPGKLSAMEREIMEKHSELSYELLLNKGLNKKTLDLIKYHHQNLKGSGYPEKTSNFDFGIESQILSVADKFSALTEERCYKDPLAKYEALQLIAQEVNSGNISQEVYNALIKAV